MLELDPPPARGAQAGARDGAAQARSASARRWAIWQEQEAAGQQACFATPLRLVCRKMDCPWRGECMKLRADWMR
ncbi:hypothetical protein MBSD_n2390 [Mizugakiibacter sediminis]|uniref:Uncharacterized protein n=2 Tax=Mizugakiibacter sediminis TaxID=1475481 RepID=A0A0K8QQB7_9GAMM|nr:hypothetical protein MBSD_n2390 [Mizugakiibacter sediminis]